jgi:putative NADH-flavin reductase
MNAVRNPVVVLGGSGYAGEAIVRAAAGAGHVVIAVSRSAPARPISRVTYLARDVTGSTFLAEVPTGSVIVGALAPRGDDVGTILPFYRNLISHASAQGCRLVVIGGHSALRPEPAAARFVEAGTIHPTDAAESAEMLGVFELLLSSTAELDWLFVSPAATFGHSTPGETGGHYRLGGEVALTSPDGPTALSADDLALAVIELAAGHARGHVSIAAAS